ncbi:hypothetical protein SDRG_04286 [Saprolegnia diclina VS20]|uniref:Uncharacterized protein n=1 Tax=Saprolegnia diclina (strain VS20) TaxID=1156394 RepID=T0S0W7_SAPDV|nr:hypothetical protein SDRG_04286 [Saprolegnia diclina VS20]EQC38583.1 hypothetical protein SDRG_04286 [Saprolegnia diclina VS20]|eukprot:XP_008608175.1 hypothetical protein SDRG_04286 [Saprolegnia diclina VS20]
MFARSVSKITAPMTRGISRSARRMGEDHHHEHRVFEDGPFNSKSIGAGIIAIVGGGAVVTVGCCKFQNFKHGFPQKKEDLGTVAAQRGTIKKPL